MAAFDYKAVDSKGKIKKGIVEADSARQARTMLREKSLMPTEVSPCLQQSNDKSGQPNKARIKGGKVSASDLALITRQLSTLVESGLPIEESLMAVGEQCEKANIRSMIMAIRTKVTEGYGLAESMAEYPQIFNNLFRAMVSAGEQSGHLDKVLDRLADYTEQREQMQSQLVQALIYPIIMTVVAVGVISVLLTQVVPEIVGQFDHMGANLPTTTKILIASSDFLSAYGLYLTLTGIGVIFLIAQLLKKPDYKMAFHQRIINVPGIGKVVKGLNTARFARTLSILTASAVPLLDSMKISGHVLDNLYMKKRIKEASDRVREGTSLKAALDETKLFPPMMMHMIASGEKSGELENMLERSADNQDKAFEALVSISLKAFEPALMVAMAGIVLFIVMAILQPILQLNNMVGG